MWELVRNWWMFLVPYLIIALVVGLRFARNYITRKKKAKAEQPETTGPAPLPPAVPAAVEIDPEKFYADRILSEERYRQEIAKAHQLAQFKATELNTPMLLTIFDRAATTGGEPAYKLEPVPNPLPPGLMISGDVTVIDRSSCNPIPVNTPRPARERHEERESARTAAVVNGTGKFEFPLRGPVGTDPLVVESTDPAIGEAIARSQAYSKEIRRKAEQELQDALPEIRAAAEHTARTVMAVAPARAASLAQEAEERGVGVEVVVNEFVRLVGDTAVQGAKMRYENRRATPTGRMEGEQLWDWLAHKDQKKAFPG